MFPVTPTVDGSRYGTQGSLCCGQRCVMCSTASATACRNVCARFCCKSSMPASVRARVLTFDYLLSLLLRECFCRIGTISPMPPSGAYNSGRLPEQVKFVSQMQRMTEPVWHICLLLLLVCQPYKIMTCLLEDDPGRKCFVRTIKPLCSHDDAIMFRYHVKRWTRWPWKMPKNPSFSHGASI